MKAHSISSNNDNNQNTGNTKVRKSISCSKYLRRGTVALLVGSAFLCSPGFAETQVRLQSSNDAVAFSEGYSLSVEDWRAQTKSARGITSGQFNHQSQSKPLVWISDIGTLLYNDYDGDGYHSGFSVTMDIDSEYGDTEVYAKIYIQPTNGSATLLHKTGRFGIYGATIGDEYRVDTELRNNYYSDDYNISIDIHDAWSDGILDTANARGFSNLRQLPLESDDYNQYDDSQSNVDDYDNHDDNYDDNGSDDINVTEYAAAFNPLILLILAGRILARRMR